MPLAIHLRNKTEDWESQERYQGFYQEPNKDLRDFLIKDSHSKILEKNQDNPFESKALLTLHDPSVDPHLKEWNLNELYWSSSEKALHPFHLLSYYLHHIDKLNSISNQTLLHLQFFKSLVSFDQILIPLDITNPKLQDLLCDFVEKGMEHFYTLRPEKKPLLDCCLFMIRFAQEAREHCAQPTKRFSELSLRLKQTLDLWRDKEEFSNSERALVHLHRIHYYHMQHKKTYDIEELSEIFASWAFFNGHPIEREKRVLPIEESAYAFILEQIQYLRNTKEANFSMIGQSIFNTLGIQSIKDQVKWNLFNTGYFIEGADGYVLDLFKGEVFQNGNNLSFSIPSDLFTTKGYLRLFGKEQFNFYKRDESIEFDYFDHPKYGTFRIHHLKGAQFVIHYFFEGKWFQYVERESIDEYSKGAFPKALILNHHHFIPIDSTSLTLVVFDLSFKEVASMDPKGVIQRRQDQAILTRVNKNASIPSLFDREDFQLVIFNQQNKPLQWEIPRFHSIHNHPLQFVYDTQRKGWGWKENPYFIMSDERDESLMRGIPNYFHLKHWETGEEKVLVPFHPMHPETTQTFLSEGKLKTKKEEDEKDLDALDQPKHYFYFTYKVEEQDRTLTPESIEGALFKAYIELHQGNYDSFLHHIGYLSLVDTPSEIAFEIMEMILNYPEEYPKLYPTSYAMVLKTALLFIDHHVQKDEVKAKVVLEKLSTQLNNYYRRYLQYIYQVNEKHVLTLNTEEPKLLKLFPDQFTERRAFIFERKIGAMHHPGNAVLTSPHLGKLPDIKDSHKLMGIDTFYKGQDADTEKAFQHLGPFHFNETFFRNAWDTLRSKDQHARRRLLFQLELIEGLHVVTTKPGKDHAPVPELLKFADRVTLEFYQYCVNIEKDRLHFPQGYQGEIAGSPKSPWKVAQDWLQSLYGSPKNSYPQECSKSLDFPPLQSFPLPPTVEMDQVRDLLTLTIPLFKKTFSNVLGHFRSFPLFPEGFKDFPEVWNFKIPPHLKRYTRAINQEIKHTKECLVEGRKKLKDEKLYILPKENVATCLEAVSDHLKNEKKEIEQLEKKILFIARQVEERSALQTFLLEGANRQNALDMPLLCQLFCKRSKQAFKKGNPALTDKDIQELYNLLGEWNYHMVLLQIVEKAQKDLLKVHEIDQKNVSKKEELKREHYCQEIAVNLLKEPKDYKEITATALTFARSSKKTPRQDQIEDVLHFNNEKEENCLLQKIMGGGKTSVDAAIWAYECTLRGKLPAVVVHNSQASQVKQNLKKSQKTSFGQEVFTIDYRRENLTVERLESILESLKEGLKTGKLLIICPEMLDILDLQEDHLILRMLKLDGSDVSIDPEKAFQVTELLHEILDFFHANIEALGDEADLLTNNYQETNVPIGEVKKVPPQRVELAKVIFSYLISENEKIDAISLRECIGIITNKQTALPDATYHKKIVPLIAKKMAESYFPSLKERKNLHEGFIRFVSQTRNPLVNKVRFGALPKERLDTGGLLDLEFLEFLHDLYLNPNAMVKEEANLISLTNPILSVIVPLAFKGSPGRHFGRWKELGQPIKTPFKVVPFLGVDNPALTELGNHYEAIVKQFLTALQFDIGEDQVQFVGEKMLEAAESQKKSEDLKETAEYQSFSDMTGEDIELVKHLASAQKGANYVNQDPLRKLELEGETAAFYATYYAARLTRRPQGLRSYFSKLHLMGGTPWNYDGYHESYFNHLRLDKGAVGSILQVLFNRAKTTHVYVPEDLILESVFEAIYEVHPERFIDAIFESGALFSHYKNKDFAITFMKFAKDKNLPFKGCVFFDSKGGNSTSSQFSAIVNGFETPIPIHGTRPQDIKEATNLEKEELFFYLSERETTGTDLELPEDCLFLWTNDEGMLLRTLLQTLLRSRKFFYRQTGEAMIPKYMIPKLAREEGTLAAIIATAIMNQGVKKTESLDRSYHNWIDEVFMGNVRKKREEVLRKKLSRQQTLENLEPLYTVYLPFIKLMTIDEPFLHHSGIEEEIDYIIDLKNYVERLKDRFKTSLHKAKVQFDRNRQATAIIENLEKEFQELLIPQLDNILNRAQTIHREKLPETTTHIPYKDPKVKEAEGSAPLDSEIFQERLIEREVERELESDLQIKLKEYENWNKGSTRNEEPWND
ncbi:MAG: DUF3638 domain-containing protein, partial [Chlamydiia bacterium]|nr:DUF3638 domain-containing protein [Chlamydiia bacterium]